ncbi:MAG: response regulator, partial [Bacteroidota bacterium]
AEGRRVVLVVEDNADMRQFIAELLAPEYEVLEAPNGKAGFATARDHIPDLIVSDVMMPILDGYALAEHLRADELTSHIPIVMLTAKAAEEERLQGLEAGVDAYLAKPFSARELQVRVRKLIELRDQLRASYSESGPAVLQATRVHVSSMDQQFLDRLQETVEARMSDERFNVGELGDLLGTSRRQLYRKVDALLGCSPASLIRQLRLSRAQQLLEQQAGTVSEVAYQVGYSSPSAFTRAYRDAYGVAPSEV